MNGAYNLIFHLKWYDILDIVLVTSMVVWLYSWVKGTRAFRVLLGLGLVMLVYSWARSWGLLMTEWALQGLGQALIVFVIIIFAPEIRQVLERLNPMRIWNRPEESDSTDFDYVDEIVTALSILSKQNIGAIIVLERSDRLGELVSPGIALEGQVQSSILLSLFQPKSPTHDGAVWVRNGIIHQVGVFLPISERNHPSFYGSRHRAALGISEISDALVLVVSEERGTVSLVEGGQLRGVSDLEKLASELRSKTDVSLPFQKPTWRSVFLKDWKVKLMTFMLVTSIWITLAAKQVIKEVYSVPLEIYNLPSQYQLQFQPPRFAQVTVSGTRLALARLDPSLLLVQVSLSEVASGAQLVPINMSRIPTPPDVTVTSVNPPFLNLQVERK